MEIKVLGPGCSKCKVTVKQVKRALKQLERDDIVVTKVEDLKEIMAYNIMNTPALVINENVKIVGRVPSVKEIKIMIQNQQNNRINTSIIKLN
ncbi:MAG: thioredoxin family protein [Candidatus Izimaplasma sp.]|nr:thioredoxin family protein [Candidatus Izimaplasma bacterium]